jgi:probable rRNA maturation factor
MPGRRPQPPGLEVVAVNRQRRRPVDLRRLTSVLRGAAEALSVRGEVALVVAGDKTLHDLNHRYRGKDKPTDVLSFPGPCASHLHRPRGTGDGGHECAACVGQTPSLGDIVISVDTASANAKDLGRTLPQELDVLALHGFLHVLGYDHETDDGTMDRLEKRLRRRLLGAGA